PFCEYAPSNCMLNLFSNAYFALSPPIKPLVLEYETSLSWLLEVRTLEMFNPVTGASWNCARLIPVNNRMSRVGSIIRFIDQVTLRLENHMVIKRRLIVF